MERMSVHVTLARCALPALLAIASVGCVTAAPVVRLIPRGDVVWASGLAVTSIETANIRVAAAFVRQRGPNLALRVEVLNERDEPVMVDPSAARAVAYCRTPEGKDESRKLSVLDPEEALLVLDQTANQNEADNENTQVAHAVLLVTSAVVVAAAIPSGDRRATRSSINLVESAAASSARAEARHQHVMSELEREHLYWSTETLRKTTLAKGQIASGMMLIPTDPSAYFVELSIAVGGVRFRFPFDQTVLVQTPPPANVARR